MQGKARLSKRRANRIRIGPREKQMASSPAPWLCAMIGTDSLRRQHDAALAMADRLIDLVDALRTAAPIHAIVMQLNRMVGLLRVHLAHEDVELYPGLIASKDPKVVAAWPGHLSMKWAGWRPNLEQFARYWSCSASIAGAFDEFREGVHELMLALAVRIERENLQLYPLAEAGPGTAATPPRRGNGSPRDVRRFVPDCDNGEQIAPEVKTC